MATPYQVLALREGDLPDLVTVALLARFLGMTPSGVGRMIRRGDLGPYARLGRRLVLRRATLLDALAAREIRQEVPRPPATGEAPAWAKALLERRRGGQGRTGA